MAGVDRIKGDIPFHGEGPAVTQAIVEYLQKLGERAGLGGWESWLVAYRVLAIVAAALLAYWLLRVAVPAAVRLVRPVLLLLLAVAVVGAVFPNEMCSMPWASKLPVLCVR